MPEEQPTTERLTNRGQVYLVILLITALASLLAGVISMWVAGRTVPPEDVRSQALHVLRNWPMVLPLVAIALTVLVGRFVRWHFLLRSLNTRAPLGTSLLAFYAGVPMFLTPAYVGELVSAFVLNRLGGGSVFRGISAIITCRAHDVIAIAVLLFLHAGLGLGLSVIVGLIAAATLAWGASPFWTAGLDVVLKGARRVPVIRWLAPASAVDAALLLAPRCFIPCLLMSVAGWYLISIILALAVSVAGTPSDVQGCSRIFLEGTLHGARHFSPGGIGFTSRYMWYHLVTELGVADLAALQASTLTRFVISGLTILVGFATFFFVFNRHRRLLAAADRFDVLSTRYDEELAGYVLERLLDRKTERMQRQLDRAFDHPADLVGVDIGCGTGGYAARMAESCGQIVAMDAAEGQVRQAAGRRRANSAFLTAQLPRLPFHDASIDFAYAINVFHHLPNREAQREAFAEVSRILRPGGVFFIHEINTVNPLFRFYMSYIFPVLHQLDDGSELWLTPDDVEDLSEMPVEEGEYFTFLPEFTPRLWQTALGFLERWLERSRLRRYSAHYMLVCRKPR